MNNNRYISKEKKVILLDRQEINALIILMLNYGD